MTQDTSGPGPSVDDMVESLGEFRAIRAWLRATESRFPNGEPRYLETSHGSLAAMIGEIDRASAEVIRLRGENERLCKALSVSVGYMTNAAIDLETGAPKKTALTTINGGIKMAREALGTESK